MDGFNCQAVEGIAQVLTFRQAPDTPANRPDQSCSPPCFGRAQPHLAVWFAC